MRNTFFLLLFLISGACFSQNPDPFWDGIKTKLVQPDTLSTFDRDAITPKLGTILYHKDTGISQWEQWDGSAWVVFGGGSDPTLQQVLDEGNTFTKTSGNAISGTISSASTGIAIANSGSGNGYSFTNSGSGNGLYGTNTSTGRGIHILQSGSQSGIQVDNSSGSTGIFAFNSSTGNGINVSNSSTGRGIRVSNTTGRGVEVLNGGSGYGIYGSNSSTGRGIYMNNSAGGQAFQVLNSSTGRGLDLDNTSTGLGIDILNSSTGVGFQLINSGTSNGSIIQNSSTGRGLWVQNNGTGNGIVSYNSSTGKGIVSSSSSGGTGFVFVGQDEGVDTFTVDPDGHITTASTTLVTNLNADLWRGAVRPNNFASTTSSYTINNLNNIETVGESVFYRGASSGSTNIPDSGDGYMFQMAQGDTPGNRGAQIAVSRATNQFFFRKDDEPWQKVWSSNNDGSGSGLDADLLRGVHWGNVNTDIITSGNITATGSVSANNYITTSDERVKKNIQKLAQNDTTRLDIDWKTYNYIDNLDDYRVGVLAQELEAEHPEFVVTDAEGMKAVKYIDLLCAKVAELERRIEQLEKKNK